MPCCRTVPNLCPNQSGNTQDMNGPGVDVPGGPLQQIVSEMLKFVVSRFQCVYKTNMNFLQHAWLSSKLSTCLFAGDFPRAWALLLEFIESGALCRNAEVSLAALKSFQEILQLNKDSNKSDDWKLIFGNCLVLTVFIAGVLSSVYEPAQDSWMLFL